VSREDFAEEITATIHSHANIKIIREEAKEIPEGPAIIATGPLTSATLTSQLQALSGQKHLYFYDAMAPIVMAESIDMTIAFRQSRYDKDSNLGQATESGAAATNQAAESGAAATNQAAESGAAATNQAAESGAAATNQAAESGAAATNEDTGDYINCPMNRTEYETFVNAVLAAPKTQLRDFEKELERYFEGCMPIEVLASRGEKALAFGPMRPVGLSDPRTGRRPYAVVQLRQDNVAGTLYNMVGFQTNIKWGAQEEVLRLIPGLQQAEFVRLGQMHRNTFINSPTLLHPTLQFRERDDLFFAGQITGTEGYVGSTMGGLIAGVNMVRLLRGEPLLFLPPTTMIGALLHYITHAEPKHFQPMKANMGLLPELAQPVRDKAKKNAALAGRARADLEGYLSGMGLVMLESAQPLR
jgi:methylenetetrahydrofolate--tRNA-(uracil-5-)-methyltransferase